eukprot:2588531-Pleurochrysis_carterae.AAC.1
MRGGRGRVGAWGARVSDGWGDVARGGGSLMGNGVGGVVGSSSDSVPQSVVRSVRALLRRQLRTVVLDEADQLLASDALSREVAWVSAQEERVTAKQRAKLKRQFARSVCETMLQSLPTPLSELQLVCASASAGRTLRTQMQPLVGASNVSVSAELISSDARPKAHAPQRVELPKSLTHMCVLWRPPVQQAEH